MLGNWFISVQLLYKHFLAQLVLKHVFFIFCFLFKNLKRLLTNNTWTKIYSKLVLATGLKDAIYTSRLSFSSSNVLCTFLFFSLFLWNCPFFFSNLLVFFFVCLWYFCDLIFLPLLFKSFLSICIQNLQFVSELRQVESGSRGLATILLNVVQADHMIMAQKPEITNKLCIDSICCMFLPCTYRVYQIRWPPQNL